MVLPQFEYLASETIGEACNLLLEFGGPARVVAGTTNLIPSMEDRAILPGYLIGLEKIPGLDYLEYDEREGLKIGTLITLRTIETSSLVREKNPAVAHTVRVVASTQTRAKGTMVGNVCNASPSCGTAPSLLTQGAKILVQGPNRDRIIQAEGFFLDVRKTSLEPREIVIGIVTPPLTKNERAVYIKHAVGKAMDLTIIGVAVKIKMKGGICTDAYTALGAVAAAPIRAPKAEEALTGKTPTDKVIVKTSEGAMDSCHPTSDIRASTEYRKDVTRAFTKRAVRRAMECL